MRKLSLLSAVVFAALALPSCSKDGASVSITNNNLVGTWAMVQTTTEEGKTIDLHPSLNRNNKIYKGEKEWEEEGSVYEELEYYEELVFTEYSLKLYTWVDAQWNYDEEKEDYYWAWEDEFEEAEYHIRDNAIWIWGMKGPTIKKLTTKELLLDWGEGEISLYRKK